MTQVWLIVLLSGLGTFALRWLPLWRARCQPGEALASHRMRRWLSGVGPAAIVALLVVSLWGGLQADPRWGRILATVLALAVVAIVHRLRRGGVALPTLLGALVYGLMVALLAGLS